MRFSPTLSWYIGRNFLLAFLGVFFVFLMLVLLGDSIELLRRAANHPAMTFDVIMQMALLKLPHMGQKMFPFGVLFGGMFVFWRLTRSHELTVTRAAGISAWQFMLPVLIAAMLLGIFKIFALNPLAATMLSRYDHLEDIHFRGQVNFLAISKSGLWLRQSSDGEKDVLHAQRVLQQRDKVTLRDVTIFRYDGLDTFKERVDAPTATLGEGYWFIENAIVHVPDEPTRTLNEYWLETELTIGKIQDNFSPPETMSFWSLPGFIQDLEDAGFSAVRHRIHWHSLLAAPLMLCAMVLLAATFTLRTARRGTATYIIVSGVMTGFLVYFLSDITLALGLSDSIPVLLAAWTPAGVTLLLGLAMLLHLEDG